MDKIVKEIQDVDNKNKVIFNRDENGKIVNYEYLIYKKNGDVLKGVMSREDMEDIYRKYSFYGDALTQREVARQFVDISLVDFKRILLAFNITKAGSCFPPHMHEEKTTEELQAIKRRDSENSFIRKVEGDRIKENERLLRRYAKENYDLKEQLKAEQEFKVEIPRDLKPVNIPNYEPVGQSINLYISDMHVGASVIGDFYKENMNYGKDEIKRRLTVMLTKLTEFGGFDTINLVLMGDMLDCCGKKGQTARNDHAMMPNNMEPREQATSFIEIMNWLVESIITSEASFCNKLNVYSVPCGNHDGNYGYEATRSLMFSLNARFPDVKTILFEDFFGIFEANNQKYLICHGKDQTFMKKGLPLYLDDKTKGMLDDYLLEHDIFDKHINVVKGDLHSDSLSSCRRYSYRNVLSLFGASDYSNANFRRNSYGVSYDLLIGNNIIRGTFENM